MNDSKISSYIYPGIIALNREITFEVIRDAVCNEFNISFDEISSSSQKGEYIEPRQIIQALAEILTSEGQSEIGMRFRGRNGKYKDHATILYSRNKFYEHYETERKYRIMIRRLLVRIGVSATYFDKKVKNFNIEKDEFTIIK